MSIFIRVIFLLFFVGLQGPLFGQKRTVNLSKGDFSLGQLQVYFDSLGISVAYSSSILPDRRIKINTALAMTAADLIELIETQTNIQSEVIGNTLSFYFLESDQYNISGTLRDKSSGEVLIGATVQEVGSDKGVVTDVYGNFSLLVDAGSHLIRASHLGYKTLQDSLTTNDDLVLTLFMEEQSRELNQVIISSREPNFNVSSLTPSTNTINLQNEGQIPYFLGEVDVLQGALLLPGIKTIGEDANGIYVRGGSVDQNLILMDEAPVYNPYHFYGLISVFNPDAINSIELLKGFIPPSYGGRASSVISVYQKEGNDQEFHLTGGIGLVSARAVFEGPIKKGKSSFIISGRQSLLNSLDLSSGNSDGTNQFQDLNLKVNLKKDPSNTFFLSGYLGNDENQDTFGATTTWGNSNISLRWNHLMSPRIVGNFAGIISRYEYRVVQPQEAASFIGNSRIIDYQLKADLTFAQSNDIQFDFGGSLLFHRLKPGDRFPFDTDTSSDTLLIDSEHGIESAIYLGKSHKIGNFSAYYGFRQSFFHYLGPGDVFTYETNQPKSDATIIDTTTYSNRLPITNYHGFEPRMSLNYQINSNKAIKASFTRNLQYLHLISNTITPSPTDIWKLSDVHLKPTAVNGFTLGLYMNFGKDNAWEAYSEGYYKDITNLISYKNGADLLFNVNPETELINGSGRAYGLEFFLKKSKGRVKGWLSYTLSRTESKIDTGFDETTINEGNYFPSDHDRTHFLSLVGIVSIGKRWVGSTSFNYSTGRPVTLPSAKYEYEGNLVPHFNFRNGSRLPDYHRLDLSMKLSGRQTKKNGKVKRISDYWTFVLYNVYARKNPYSYVFTESEEIPGLADIKIFSVIDNIVPGVTYNFKF